MSVFWVWVLSITHCMCNTVYHRPGQINNRELQQAASKGSSLEIRVAAPSRLTIDFIWSTYTSHHVINLQGRFTDACSPTKGPMVSGLPPTSRADLQLFYWFPYLRQAAAFLYKSCFSAAYSMEQSDVGLCDMTDKNASLTVLYNSVIFAYIICCVKTKNDLDQKSVQGIKHVESLQKLKI